MATPGSLVVRNGNGQSAIIGTAFAAQIQVQAYDTGGSPMTGVQIVFSVPQTGASGTFSSTGSSPFTATTGLVGYVNSDTIYANSIEGSWLGLVQFVSAPGVSTPFSLNNAPKTVQTISIVSGDNQKVPINGGQYAPLKVLAVDNIGNPVYGIQIRFEAQGSNGTFPGGQGYAFATTIGDGTATSPTFTANASVGEFNMVASAAGRQVTALWENINPATPFSIAAISGGGQSAAVGTNFAGLQCRVTNEAGAPVSGVWIRWAGPAASGAYCLFGPTLTYYDGITDAGGYSTSYPPTAAGAVGTYAVVCNTRDVTVPYHTQFTLTNGAAPVVAAFNTLSMMEV